MTRYLDPSGAGAKPVTSAWHTDSLGQVQELDEQGNAPQLNTYSNWGELREVRRNLTVAGAPVASVVAKQYDALGRLIHSEQRDNGVVDPDTVNDYAYDQAVNAAPQVTATNLIGRLALASSPTGDMAFSYDSLGQMNARVFTDGTGGMYIEKHGTHADGTPATLDLLLPDTGFVDEHVDYAYDSAGRMKSVKYNNGSLGQDLYTASSIDTLGRVLDAQYGAALYEATYA